MQIVLSFVLSINLLKAVSFLLSSKIVSNVFRIIFKIFTNIQKKYTCFTHVRIILNIFFYFVTLYKILNMSIISDKILNFNRSELIAASQINNEISFYSELAVDIKQHPYYHTFYRKLKTYYKNSDKVQDFVDVYLSNKIPTVEICDTVFSGLKDIFEGQNQNINIEVTGKEENEVKAIMQQYFEYFKNEGWNHLKHAFNSFVVIDIEEETQQPYIYNVLPEFVKYYDFDDDNNLTEIIFSFDGKEFYYYTDLFYSVYIKVDNEYILKVDDGINQYFEHEIGKCPATLFLRDKFNNTTKILSKIVLNQVSNLLFWYVIRYVELLMIESNDLNKTKIMPDLSCGYKDSNSICKGGKLFNINPDIEGGNLPILNEDGHQKLCNVCGHNRIIGSGGAISYSIELMLDNKIDVKNLMSEFSPNLDSINYAKTRLLEQKNEIIESTIGILETNVNQAKNETQIKNGVEKATKIRSQFGYTYAITIQFAYDIILKILYKKLYEYCNIFLGDKFYLLTKQELIKEKEQSTNPVERSEIEQQILEIENKHDKERLKTLKKIYEQLPYSGITDLDFLELIKLNKISDFDIELRTNINFYVSEYERTNKNPTLLLDYDLMNETITKLVNQKLSKRILTINPSKTL